MAKTDGVEKIVTFRNKNVPRNKIFWSQQTLKSIPKNPMQVLKRTTPD